MSFINKVSQMSAAKAQPPKALPAAIYAAVVTSITWPSEDEEPKSFQRDGQDIEYINPEIEVKVQAIYGDHDLDDEEVALIEKMLPRKFKHRQMITSDNPDSGLLLFKSLIYDACELADPETDETPIVEMLPEVVGKEVLLETYVDEFKTKAGEDAERTAFRRFHSA